MTSLDDSLSGLSPEQRAALELLLRRERSAAVPQTIAARADRKSWPLSFAQQRLWFLDQLAPGDPAYNIHGAVRLHGPLEIGALARSLEEVAGRHEVLRANFLAVDGRPWQVVSLSLPRLLPVLDLRGLPAGRREAEVFRLAVEEARRPFDLARDSLLRTLLVRNGDTEAVLFVTMHHIVSDGWSIGVLLRELSSLYGAFAAGRPSPLSPLPLQYADFASWQRGRLQGEVLAREIEHWRGRLADLPELRLPRDSALPEEAGPYGGAVPVAVPPLLAERLRMVGRAEGASLFTVLLAVFAALLSRWSGQRELGVGTPVANRSRPEIEGLIGFFVNILVLRADLSGDPSFTELVSRAKRESLDALSHQDLPFERLVEELRPERRPGHTPLVPVLLALQNAPLPTVELPGLDLSPYPVRNGTARFELSLVLTEGEEGIVGDLEYDGRLFSRTAALRMADGFRRLAERLAAEPGRPMSEVSLLSKAERQQILGEWAGVDLSGPAETFVEMFEAQADRTPEALAVIAGSAALSYRELDRRASRVARHLRRLGAGPEARVALRLERSVDLIAAVLGVMKAGGAYVPLDPAWPEQRLASLLEDAEPAVVVTGWRNEDLAGESEERTGYVPPPDSLAYVIYTSGSTGRPKGTLVSHGALAAFARGLRRAVPELRSEEPLRLSLNASFAFDASLQQIAQLAAGHALHLVPKEARHDSGAMAAFLRDSGLDGFDCTPSQLEVLLPAFEASGRPPRFVLVGGEEIPPARWKTLAEHPRTRFYDVYGPTECTVDATAVLVEGSEPSLGRPLPGYRVHLLDAWLQPVPAGARGEVWIGGEGLARGYWRRPDLTVDRFRPDPFGRLGARLYRTGDLGRWLPDGRIGFLGRADQQVKLRGFRVEPAEVEACLLGHPQVREAAAGVRDGGRRLVAWVTPAEGHTPEPRELRRWLRERLPEPMVPAAIEVLAVLPRTPSGKLDRRVLPEPRWESAGAEPAMPPDPLEMGLIDLFREVLDIERVGLRDSFFELGGHSLLAARLASRVRATFGVELPVRRLFESPTVAELADAVRDLGRSAPPLPPIRRVPRYGAVPLSFAQRRLWVLHQLTPELTAYHVPAGLHLRGLLDAAALAGALSEIVRRHESLRTRFVALDGEPVQAVNPPAPVLLPEIDLSTLASAEREREARRIGGEEARRPFDLERGPLLRLRLLRLEPEEHTLFLTVHHLVSDGWSAAIFLRELSVLYGAFSRGEPSPLAEPAVQYADYAIWQREQLRGEALEEQLRYWVERLASAPRFLDLPTDYPPPDRESPAGASVPLWIPAERIEELRSLGRTVGATLYMTLLAAFQALLSRWSGEETVCAGTPVAGRNRLEIEGLIGFFVNTLVIRTDLGDTPPVRGLLGRVREAALGAFAHQDLPFERLVEALNPERDARTSPLFQVVFTLQNAPREEPRLSGLEVSRVDVDNGTTQFDLILSLTEREDGAVGSIRYRTGLYAEPTVRRLAAGLDRLLVEMAASPDRPVAELSLLGEAERRQILAEWSRAEIPVEKEVEEGATTFPSLFETQADRTPEALAVVSGSVALSYRELDRWTNRIADRLRRLGVGPEERVGVFLERSPEAIAALLGILKAGGVYVPLDPALPRERLAFLLEDAAPALVLTESRLRERLGGTAALALDQDLAGARGERLSAGPGPDQLAYIIYTSGSTGQPKGVAVRHRSLIAFGRALRLAVPELREPALRLSLHLSLSFDASFEQIVQLAWGHTLCLVPETVRAGGEAMADHLRENAPDGIDSAPSQLPLWLEATEAAGWWAPRLALVGGEAISAGLWKRLAAHPLIRFYNVYGPTEATIGTAAGPIVGERPSLGRPLPGYRVHLLDARLQPLPAGARGEIWIGGEGLARGYWRRPELTADRFRPDPFGGEPGGRLYRTGDLGRWLPDGRIDFLGRADQQVKLRGFRVEPGEIEAHLLAHPEVREATVGVREDRWGEKRLVAWVVPSGDRIPDPRELRQFLRERLPDPMVPSALLVLDALPRTPGGKVDRRALPGPEKTRSAVEPPPPGSLELELAGLFQEVLDVEQVGLEDSLFDLGGHSLSVFRLATRVREVLGVQLSVPRLFASSTVAGAAELVRAAQREVSRPARSHEGPVPLSFAQQRLWVLQQLNPGLNAYNMPAGLRLRGRLDVPALQGALSEIVRRHEALRTRLEIHGGQPMQWVEPASPLPLPVVDLSALPLPARTEEEERLEREEARLPFDLERPPLLRARLFLLGSEEHLLLLTVHHIASDAWSVGVAIGELGAHYATRSAGRPALLPELPLQYADFAAEQRETFQGESLEREIAFWRERLAGAQPPDLPIDRPRRSAPSFRGATLDRALPASAASHLQRLVREDHATPFTVLLAPFLALLARITGVDDVVVGTTVTGRDRPELRDLIGFFVNILVLRTDLGGDPDGHELLARVRRTALEAFSHQTLPFEMVVDELGMPRDPHRPPLLRVLVQYLGLSMPPLELPGLVLEKVELPQGTAKFDLVVNLRDTPEGFRTSWVYDTDQFDSTIIALLAEAFATLLCAWAERPGLRLSELPLLTEGQRHQLLVEWNEGPPEPLTVPLQRLRCLHHRFEAQADRTPDATAVTFEEESLTYRDLDERANRLARYLLARGVLPGDRIALRFERSAEMIVALLAVLKAGAAYVPLDPAWPRERTDFVLEDSGARLLLSAETGLDGSDASRPAVTADPALPAYVMYTSGSTGRPKGVVVSHANVDRLLGATHPWLGAGPEDVWTLFHSYAFDFSVWEIWGALAFGGRLVVVPYGVSRSPEDFYRLLAEERVTVLNQTPSAFRQLLWVEEPAPLDLSLRLVIFGGEALEPASLRPWAERHGLGRPRLVNMYGITETTVHVTWRPLAAEDLERGSRIGRPIPDLTLHLLDRGLMPQPVGVPGEICVGGAGLAQGYLGRPDLTAGRFVPDPFSSEPGARLYRSGDLARRLPDGDLEYLGRIDHQVKVRGFRIEPGEIEAALTSHPAVREAVVVAREDGPGGERRLVAYVRGDGAPDLRAWLVERLPDPMIPAAFVFLEALPLTANGKVDRAALPAPEGVPARRPSVAPRTSLEQYLAELFQQVLGIGEIGVEDDFFALGGNSITGAILIHRLQETLGEIVHVVAIFDCPTVASLAAYVAEQHPRAARRLWGEAADEEDREEAPAGPAEVEAMRRLIVAGRTEGDAPSFEELRNPPALFVLSPPRSGTTLLRVMLGAHPSLFAPPELELLSFRTLAGRRAAFQGRDSFWLEGVIRAVMEARGCGAEEAERIVAEAERAGWTTRRFYRELQGWIGPRTLVDKTPSYALDPEVLRRAEEGFESARYLHLVRHPQAVIRSFEEARLDQVFFRRPHPFTRRQLAELVWTVSHQNILGFLAGAPEERKHAVRFEELVREPARVLSGICDFLGLEYRPEMADPYQPGAARMVDGPHAVSRPLGDVKLLAHGKVDAAVAERWREAGGSPLGSPASEVAVRLGYAAAPSSGALVLLRKGSPDRRPFFCVHPGTGGVFAYRDLARRLGGGIPFYGIQATGLLDAEEPLRDIGAMAERYLEEIRSVQPRGPWRLGGWSFGGLVALEMARRLREKGEEVEALVLIDPTDPRVPSLETETPGEEALLESVRRRGAPEAGLSDVGQGVRVFQANLDALRAYRLTPYDGPLTVFEAADRPPGAGSWRDLAPDVRTLPGTHHSILAPPGVEELARGLREVLEG
ncbi:MAG TPA: amino acid adenylation domain-containing protein [Thermoanaerobaculia bacterium]